MLTPRQQIEIVSRAYTEGYMHGLHDGVCLTKHDFIYRDDADSKICCRMNEIYPLVSQRMKDELSQCEEVANG